METIEGGGGRKRMFSRHLRGVYSTGKGFGGMTSPDGRRKKNARMSGFLDKRCQI